MTGEHFYAKNTIGFKTHWILVFYKQYKNKPAPQAADGGCRRRPSPAEAPPIGKIRRFIKMAVTFEPLKFFERRNISSKTQNLKNV